MIDPLHAELLDIALVAAGQAGELLLNSRPANLGVAATKSSPIDVVTEMDLASQKLITDYLAERRPDDAILAEEGSHGVDGQGTAGSSGVRWVIDPLDGTVNYLYGLPAWSVSIAAEVGGETVVGVVAIPSRGELCHAVRGEGAFLGGERVHCRPAPPFAHALIATGFNYLTARRDAQSVVARALLPQIRDIRRAGSAAIDLCDLGSGRLDGFYERGLYEWDFAAGVLFAREAGALAGGRPGQQPSTELTVAAVPGVFERLQRFLETAGAWHD